MNVRQPSKNVTYAVTYKDSEYTDPPEILFTSKTKYKASKLLVNSAAMYEEINGRLYQFREETDDYDSINDIYDIVYRTGILIDGDDDIYKIEEIND